jgi:hypothetical protein
LTDTFGCSLNVAAFHYCQERQIFMAGQYLGLPETRQILVFRMELGLIQLANDTVNGFGSI